MKKISYYIFAYAVLLLNYQVLCLAISSSKLSLSTDQSALLSLQAHITLDPYRILTSNWTNSSSVCSWIGVTCGSHHHRVTALNISYMGLTGTIPQQLGNLSFLVSLDLRDNLFSGTLPQELSHLRRLKIIALNFNNFNGEIPSWFGLLPKLEILYLTNNSFTGFIPNSLSNLSNLKVLEFPLNSLQGEIPQGFVNLHSLQNLNMEFNRLSGPIPPFIFNMSTLKTIGLTSNELSGSLPIDMCGNLSFLERIYLSRNQLSGQIPSNLSQCSQLQVLSLSHNFFTGQIPREIGMLKSLDTLYLGMNILNGPIPDEIDNLQNLVGFDIGGNLITGIVPLGIFNISSLQRLQLGENKFTGNLPREIGNLTMLKSLDLSYNNFTGTGSFGSVYKGTFRDGKVLAIKVFNLQSEAAFKSFDVECQVLRNIRHRNLTKVISSCSNEDFKALVLEYMPNGSLEKWLYSHNYCLNVMQRLNIMIDVASALEYLHHGYSTPIVHCDFKPSNVLIDEEMVGHVSDFGIAKLLGEEESTLHTNTLATLGYIAPEYGLEGLVSIRCDVYSFGIMLMETFTRKRPSDDMFTGDLSLKSWVQSSLANSPIQVIDANLLNFDEEHFDKSMKCASSILELALKCSTEPPGDRINMKEVVAELQKIKHQIQRNE